MSENDLNQLTAAILELKSEILRMAEKQEQMVEDVKKIKEAVYNPDEGIYARLRDLEQWKETQSKIQWAIIMAIVTLGTASIYKIFTDL
jgi:hypothetical protein